MNVAGCVNGIMWELKSYSIWLIKLFWVAFILLGVGIAYFTRQAEVGILNRVSFGNAQISAQTLAEDRYIKIDGPLTVDEYFTQSDKDSEDYYTVWRSTSGILITKSSLPTAANADHIEGIVEPIPSSVRGDLIAANVPATTELLIDIGKAPMSLWISVPALIVLTIAVILFLVSWLGWVGFRPAPVPPYSTNARKPALGRLIEGKYWKATWITRSLGAVSSAVIPHDDSFLLWTSVESEMEIEDVTAFTSTSKVQQKIRFSDIRNMQFGTIPVWSKKYPALRIEHKKRAYLYDDDPNTLLEMLATIGAYYADNQADQSKSRL